MATTPVSRCTAAMRSESATESAIGISIRTCLPARMTCSACAAWTCVGLARMTASTPGWASVSARSEAQCGMCHFWANSRVLSGRPPVSEMTSTSGMFWIASRCRWPNAPWPASAIFIGSLPARECPAATRRGRRAVHGHVVEKLHLQIGLLHRAAQRNPVERLRRRREQPLARQRLERFGVPLLERVEQAAVELFVDHEVAQPARGRDRYAARAVPRLNRSGDGLAEFERAFGRGLVGRIAGVLEHRQDG